VIQRAGYDLLRVALRIAVQLWPLWLFWFAWSFADTFYRDTVLLGSAHIGNLSAQQMDWDQYLLWRAWPVAALLGPALLTFLAVMAYRARLFGRLMGIAGIVGMAIATGLTVYPEVQRLGGLLGQGYTLNDVLHYADASMIAAGLFGAVMVVAAVTGLARPFPVGSRGAPLLLRARSDNFGHAAWLSMRDAQKLFPGPDPTHGGIVVGEAYRVDEDRGARMAFDPASKATWGRGGTAPLLVDPCRTGPTHALVLAGSGGLKTTSVGIPTLLTWTGSAVVLDPSQEIGPMVVDYREKTLGHNVVFLDPSTARTSGVNVLDWIDIASPLAESHVAAVVGWITGETRPGTSSSGEFFKGSGQDLVACLLADMLWDPTIPPARKTLRTLQRQLVTPEDKMRELLGTIHGQSASAMARDLAGTLKGAVAETFSGIYANANRDARWLSTAAYADLVSGGAEGSSPAMRTGDLVRGKTTAFLQIPLTVLQTTPAVGRVLVGALLNAAYQADGRVQGRVLFLLDEVARLGYMQVLEQARDAGRKYGITLLLLYQSLGQLVAQWGREGKQAWYDSTSWRLFAAVQDPDTAKELSAMCGEYGVVATSQGDTEGSQARSGIASSSSGRSENRSEIKRALIKPDELTQDTRTDEAFILVRGSKPLRCGRAVWFRRPEWVGLVGANRFHRDDQDAAD
jgi:type IV secretion system protein VirD4